MADTKIEKLVKEIEELERQISSNPFGGLFDRGRMDKLYRKLTKKKKELASLQKSEAPPEKPTAAAAKTPGKKSAPAKKTPARKSAAGQKTAAAAKPKKNAARS